MLEGLCEQVYRIRAKEYIYKRDGMGRLLTEKGSMRLVSRDLGSAINTFRNNQMKSSTCPQQFWD